MTNANDPKRWLSPAQAAEYLGCSRIFLAKDRAKLQLLPFSNLGRLIRYDIRDLDAYLEGKKST